MGQLTEKEREVFKTWIYKGRTSVFDLAQRSEIEGCGLYFEVNFHPFRVHHALGKRRGCEPDALASRIEQECGVKFDRAPGKSSGQLRSRCEQSPFDASVQEKAVKTSVAILKAIAAMP